MISRLRKDIKQAIKLIVFLILEVSLFFAITQTLGGITIPDFKTAFIIIIALSIVNAILWPTVTYLSLRFIVLTLGFGTFLIDGILLYIISLFIPGVYIEGIALFSIPLLIGLISSILTVILNIDDDSAYYRYILEKEMKAIYRNPSKKEGFIFLEIDGLAYEIIKEALDNGDMPTLKGWINKGSHKLIQWETDLSSQTSSSQAGILHGNNNNIPAFRWVEKENDNRIVSSNGRSDSKMIENRISDGKGLLSQNGASRTNLFSGDAKDYLLTFSKFSESKSIKSKSWFYLYSTPFIIARILLLFMLDMLMELISRIRHLVKNINPRMKRGLKYFVARAGTNVVLREATTFTIIGDIFAGQYNVVYATYMGYDEIAHHSGMDDFDSIYSLRQIDKQFKHIENALENSNRDYKVIILSDHGQSKGPTFKQKFNISLNDLVMEFLPENISVHSILHSNDDHFAEEFSLRPFTHENREKLDKRIENTKEKIDTSIDNTKEKINTSFDGELINTWEKLIEFKNNSASKQYLDKIKKDRKIFNHEEPLIDRINNAGKELNINLNLSKEKVTSDKTAQTIVLASGNLGLVYFTDWSNRMSYEQIEDAFPGLINGLASHEGIGFVMVKSDIYGTIVFSKDNLLYLDSEEYMGDDFLDKFGKNTIKKLKRTDSFAHVPDILVSSDFDLENGEVYAFEELISSHGGVGGYQQYPFILCPSDWEDEEEIVGSENVYKFFMKEINKSWNQTDRKEQ